MNAEQLEAEIRRKMTNHALLRTVPGKHAERERLHAEIDLWLDRWRDVERQRMVPPSPV